MKKTTTENFQPIKNPYIVGNPIKSKEMFFGREDDFKNIQNWIINEGPHVILLIGGRRSGKTSILWQILAGRLHHAGEAVLCDFHKMVPRIKQDEDFPFEVGQAILENPQFKPYETEFLKDDNTSWTVRLEQLVQNCLERIKPRKLMILCDEFEAIEELFKSQLSPNALLWVKQVLNLPVHFVMTGSHEFQHEIVSQVFGPVAQIYPIYELSKQDTLPLIKNPIGGNLIYKDKVPEIIYRLSGGHPFYTQYICHTLVNHVNDQLRRNYVVAKDLDGVIEFIVRSPTGHIQETWRSLSNPDTAPKYGRETLAALANTIRHSNEYISTSKIFKTVRKKRFEVDKQAMYKTLAWFIQNHRLLERKSENYRFRTDLIRHWIAYEFQTGEDIEPMVGGSVLPPMPLETEIVGKPIDWIQKYKESCIRLKDKYPNDVPQNELNNLHDTYIYNGGVTEAQAIEIEKDYKIYDNGIKKYLWAAGMTLVIVLLGVVLYIFLQQPKQKDEIEPSGIVDKGGNTFKKEGSFIVEGKAQSNQGNIFQDEISGLVFVWIPNCDFDDITNCTSGFWMSKTEVSQKQWMDVMKSQNPSYYQKGDTYPVEHINWQEAKAFAARVNKRLCSPQEWQKAFSYLKKNIVLDNAILGKPINAGPEPVDYGEKSELGVLNLIGNVSELLDKNGQAASSGLYWADIKTNSNFERAKQINTVFSLFKSSRIGLRLCMTQ